METTAMAEITVDIINGRAWNQSGVFYTDVPASV
jgi:hypothetical protein